MRKPPPRHRAASGRAARRRAAAWARQASSAIAETLEQRQLLSATSDGFTASFFGAQYTSVAAFPAPNKNTGDYSTHVDLIDTSNGTQTVAPADAPATFNPNAGTNGQGYEFSGLFTTHVVVQQSGFFTFYPTTDDGAQINLDGVLAGSANLGAARGLTQDTDPASVEWLAGSTHAVQFYYNNGGGGWGYELRWSESSGAAGSGTDLIPYSLMTGTGAPGVANLEAPTPIVVPPVPAETGSTTNSITLSWSSHDVDAASYIIERSTSATGTFAPVNAASPVPSTDGGTDTYLDTGLTRSTTYYYKLVSNSIYGSAAVGAGAEPTSAATAGITTLATNPALAAPPVAVVPGAGGNVLTIDQVANATTYNILSSSTRTGTYTQVGTVAYSDSASTLTYTDAGNNANSFYEIQAVDTAVPTTDPGYSTTSGPATLSHGDGFGASYYTGDFNGGTTFSASTVFQPSTLASIATFSTIVPAINSGPQGVGNSPVYAPAGFNSAQTAGQGADFSTEFDFTVVAPYSGQFTFLPRTDDGVQLTVDGTILDHQGSRGATTDAAVVPVAWLAGSTHTVQMAYYQGTGEWEADLGWTSPSLAALYPGGFYSSNGEAVPGFDANAMGVAPTATPTTPVIADPPVLSVTNFTGTTVDLSFTASEGDSYSVYRGTSPGGEGATPIGSVTGSSGASPGVAAYSYTDSSVTTGATYYYIVKAVNDSGVGVASNEVTTTPLFIPPAAPTNVTGIPGGVFPAALTLGGSAPAVSPVVVSWTFSQNASSYDVLRASVTGGVAGTFATIAAGVTATTYTDATAAIDAQYEYEVVARNTANPTGASPGSTSAPSAIAHTDQGAIEEYYANNTELGGAGNISGGSTAITAAPGTPADSSEQPNINFNDSNGADLPPGGTQGTNYSTLFTGKVEITKPGSYTFYSNTDDQGILYVDGALVAVGNAGTGNTNNGTVLTLNAGSYDFQMFMSQEAGGQRFELLYSGPDTSNVTVIVPQSALTPLTGAPAAATNLHVSVGAANAAGTTYPVTVTFNDNADNELGYELQRSSDAAFDGSGGVVTVAATGLLANGAPQSGGAPAVGAGSMVDPAAPEGKTFYYRVVAVNFEGSAASTVTPAVIIPTSSGVAGLEVNFFNNEWWRSTNPSTTAIVSGGVGSATSTSALVSDEQTVLPDIDGAGSDSGTGTLESGAASPKYPDPAGTIGPDDFSDVFTGQVNITAAGSYTFAANTDDDGYLYVDDRLVSSYPNPHGDNNAEVNYSTTLTAGKHDIEFFESNGGGGWAFEMYYSGADTSNTSVIVPSSVLSSLSGPLVAPATFTAAPNDSGGVTLTWSNNNTSAVRYVIERSTDPTFNSNVTTFDAGLNSTPADVASYPATSTYTDSGFASSATYYYRIYAQNFDGTSLAATATAEVPAAPPTGVASVWSGSTVDVTWLADANAVSYNVYRATTPGGEGATPLATGITTTSYTDASVAAGQTYYYQITAVNSLSWESARSFEVETLASPGSTVIISELQAINNTTLADSAGDYPDWLELYNPTASAVNLNGYYLTDKASDLTDWEFPSVTLASGAFMVVFCDSASQTNPAQQLHTNFNLGGSGGYVALVAPNGTTVLSSYDFPQQLADGAYGVAMAETTSGGSTITSFGAVGYLNPTPGAPNGAIIGVSLTPEPAFSQAGGFYTSSFQLTLSDTTAGAAIYYTLDGSLPSPTNGMLYTGPITISGQTAMRAVAIGPDDVPSFPNTDTFIYTAQVVTQDANGQPPPGWPSSWGLSVAHYGMNPAVVDSPLYSSEIQSDLLDVPTFSITMNLADLFDPTTGIYSNSEDYGGTFTRAASVQYILPSGSPGFTANIGLAIKGDASASSPDAMHGFRLEFANEWGQSDLDYPLFSTGTNTFEEVDLRCDQNNSWDFQDPQNYIGIRDQFTNATMAAMGEPGQRSQICYLYINGIFWGLYDAIDRTDANWAANTYGGSESDYDAIKSGGEHNGFTIEAADGTMTAWDELVADMSTLDFSSNANYEMIQGNNPDGTPNPAYQNLLNVPELIQYMMVIDYTGNLDAPNSTFISNNPNNFYAVRPIDGSFGFQFMATDSEWTLLDVNTNRVNSSPSTVTDETATPAFFFQQLETNPSFKQLVAADIEKDFFNNGPLSVSATTARFESLAAEVYGPVVEQSARWGDTLSLPPYVSTAPANPYTYTRNVDWQTEINNMESSYLPQRTSIVVAQLQAVGLFPSVAAPTFSQFGGTVAAGYQLNMSNPNSSGSIYYTLDGSDPVTLNGTLSSTAVLYTGPVILNTTTEVQAVVLSGSTFSAVTDATFDVPITTVQVTELDYDPNTPAGGIYASDDDEFIELKNFGAQAVNLDGASFTNGITYTFGNVSLAPGQVGVVVSNPDAFAALYGNNVNVLGTYEPSGTHFSNSGEEVTLVDATGQTMVDFTYSPSWYPITAGGGPSLEVVDPASNPDLNLAASWEPSPEDGGTPGVDDSIPTGPPTGLTGAFTNQQLALTWSAVAGAASYNVYRGTTSGGEGTTPIATGLTTTGFIDTTAAGGNTYYYTVAAVDPGGVSTVSNEAAVIVPTTPYVPVIATQPLSQLVNVGGTASFTTAASGYPLPTVQWNVSDDGGLTWSPISGPNSTTYSFAVTSAALDGTEYQAVFTNSQGSTPTDPATLTAIAAPLTAWNFDTSDVTGKALSTKGTNTSPDPSTGTGTAGSIGMALVSGPDASNILVDAGSSDTSSTNQAWRIVGTNGWSSIATIASQGAQFLASTVGYGNVSVQFDLDVTAQGEGNLAVEYTTNGGSTWSLAPSLNANGDANITVLTNTSSANTVMGQYFHASGSETWYNRLTADLNGVAGVANNPNFGIRLVNASTGADCVNLSGAPLNNTSGNWRVDEVDIDAAPLPSVVVTTQPVGQVATVGSTASFTAAATGTPAPTVQWNVSTDGGNSWSPVTGATSPTYSFTVGSIGLDGSEYEAVFTNSLGSATSDPAILTAVAAPFTAWNFDTSDVTGAALPATANSNPDPSTGAGTAASIGMALVSGPDASAVLADAGSSDTSSTNQAWKVVGTNGWSSTAPIGLQGAQFLASTVGFNDISVQFDLNLTAQGEGNLAVEYTTDGGDTWNDATSLSTNGDPGITVATNTTSPNTIQGEYFSATGGALWYNRLTADFSGVPNVANNPNFGIRLVNASTGADCVNSTGAALNNTSGNWRFDEVDINGVVATPAPAVVSITTNDGEDTNTVQESEIRQLVVTFSEAVSLTQPGAFSLGVYNLDGTGGAVSGNGSNDGSITDISSVLNTATSSDGGITWTITFAPGTSNTDASASLIDGIYSFTINNPDVAAGGQALTGSNTFTFHRLYGDITGTGAVNNTDARDFSKAYGAAAGSANYNAALDYGGAGANINNTDARDFSMRYGQTFTSVLPAGGD